MGAPHEPDHEPDEERDHHRRVKVTDKRRVRADGTSAEAPVIDPGSGPVIGTAEPAAGGELTSELETARADAAQLKDQLQRLAADFDNARKRMLKDQTRAVEMASEGLVARLLEVLDDFQLALMAAEQKPDFDRFLHGVELVYAKLADILRSEGLEPIEASGRPFDPTKHEALMQSGDGDGEPVVADVFRPGYTLKGRVIRPAGVRVTRGER